jgi:hypothetical protein
VRPTRQAATIVSRSRRTSGDKLTAGRAIC